MNEKNLLALVCLLALTAAKDVGCWDSRQPLDGVAGVSRVDVIGYLWEDSNSDGRFEVGSDFFKGGATVELFETRVGGASDLLLASAVTEPDGSYEASVPLSDGLNQIIVKAGGVQVSERPLYLYYEPKFQNRDRKIQHVCFDYEAGVQEMVLGWIESSREQGGPPAQVVVPPKIGAPPPIYDKGHFEELLKMESTFERMKTMVRKNFERAGTPRVRIVDDNNCAAHPDAHIQYLKVSSGKTGHMGSTPPVPDPNGFELDGVLDYLNGVPGDVSYVYLKQLGEMVEGFLIPPLSRADSLDVRVDDIARVLSHTSTHEIGHAIGLVLDRWPDSFFGHNYAGDLRGYPGLAELRSFPREVMNSANMYEDRRYLYSLGFGENGVRSHGRIPLRWNDSNADYLQQL